MTDDTLALITRQITDNADSDAAGAGRNFAEPPLEKWHPELSGNIDIVIKRDGEWVHEGSPIRRLPLVQLFASILRREEDGDYYLVTPAEKWRLQVEALPLVITDFETRVEDGSAVLAVTLNTGRSIDVDAMHPLYLPQLPGIEDIPAVKLKHGLAALFSRAAWYRLVAACEETPQGLGVHSHGQFYRLG